MNDTLNNTAASGGDLSSGITVGQTMGQQEAVNMATGQTGWQANEHFGSDNTGDFIVSPESSITIPEETKTNDDKYSFITDAFEVVTKPFQALNDTIEDWHKKKPQSKTLAESVLGKETSDKLEYSMNGLGTKENPLVVPKAEKTELQKMSKPEDYHLGKKIDPEKIEKTEIPKIANGQPDVNKSQSASFYDEENTYEGVSKETDRMINANSRPRERVISNGGDISAVAKYIDSLPESERFDAFHKLGKEYYLAGAGDVRAGLEIFSKTGDIIGNGTAKKIMGAIELANEGEIDAAAAMLDQENVKITENLFSILWKNNEANKALISLGASELAGVAAGKLISKAGEAVLPKAVDKLISISANTKNEKVFAVTEKILSALSKNQKVRNSLKNEKLIRIYEKEFSNPAGNPADNLDEVAELYRGVYNAARLSKPFKDPLLVHDVAVVREAARRGLVKAKDLAVAAAEGASISPNKGVGVAAATGAGGSAGARPILPKQAETIAEQSPTGVVEKFDKNKKLEKILEEPEVVGNSLAAPISQEEAAKGVVEKFDEKNKKVPEDNDDKEKTRKVVQDYLSNIEAKKGVEEMSFAQSKKSPGEIIRNAYSITNTEMPDYVKQIADKMDNVHKSNVSAKEKEEKYKDLYGQYDIAKILSDLGIPVVSSVLKALEAWRSGDWTAENRASGREFVDVTNKLKKQWTDGGFKDKISALIDAASGYKKATQNTKMYKSLKATQKAVGEILITALGIPAGAAPVMLAVLGKNAISNALKDVSDGQVSLDNFSEDDWYVSLNSNSDTTENEMDDIEITDPNKMEKEVTDFTGYNKGLEEEEKTRKEVPSDFILKVFRKEPKTFGWIRNV